MSGVWVLFMLCLTPNGVTSHSLPFADARACDSAQKIMTAELAALSKSLNNQLSCYLRCQPTQTEKQG